MSLTSDLMDAFEEHSVEGIRSALAAGASTTQSIDDPLPVDCLIEGYLRSTRFPDCLRLLLEAGATLDPLLQALLLDDDAWLRRLLAKSPQLASARMQVPAAFTCCHGKVCCGVQGMPRKLWCWK